MTRPTQPQPVDTESDAYLWQWRTFEGFEPEIEVFAGANVPWLWVCAGCGEQGAAAEPGQAEAAAEQHVRTVHQVEHEFELEWLRTERRWQVRSSYDRAGWCEPLTITTLDDPDTYQDADRLAHEYAARPRGGGTA